MSEHGAYELIIPWKGPTEFEVSGRYYDELNRRESARNITLQALVDVQADTLINLNLFTTLLHRRMYQLFDDKPFDEALAQANEDLARLLGLDLPEYKSSKDLDLTDGENQPLIEANTSLLLFSAATLKRFRLNEDGEADESDSDLPGLDALLDDFADDGDINDAALSDWEDVINAGTDELLSDAQEGLKERGFDKTLPNTSLPPWAGKMLVSLHDVSYPRNATTGLLEMQVQLRLSAPAKKPVTVRFIIEPMTAVEGVDYENLGPAQDLVIFESGNQTQSVQIPLLASSSSKPEKPPAPKTLRLLLKNPRNAELGRHEMQASIPVDGDIVRQDFRFDSLELVRLRDGSRTLSLSGEQLYARGGALTAELKLKSSIDCSDPRPDRLMCVEDRNFSYFAQLDLISGDLVHSLGAHAVTSSEIHIHGRLVVGNPPSKTIRPTLSGPEFDEFISKARRNGTPIQFRVTAQLHPLNTIATSMPNLAPYDDVLSIDGIRTNQLDLSSITPRTSCPGSASHENLWLISGSSDWQPARDDSWGIERINYTDLCVELKYNSESGDWEYHLQSGEIHIPQLVGHVGGILVTTHGNVLDRNGISMPETVFIELPADHSWHEIGDDGRPKPRGSQSIVIQPGDDDYFTWRNDFSSMQIGISGGFIHARGLPFSMQARSLSLSPDGLMGTIQRFHYNFDQAYRRSDPRNLDRQGPVSNDARFAQPSTVATDFHIDSTGLHIPELSYPAGRARTHYPRSQVEWSQPLSIAIVAGRIEHHQVLYGAETYRFDFAGNCGGCVDAGAKPTRYELTTSSASGLAGDGAIAAWVSGLVDPAWGPLDTENKQRIFQRMGDNNLHGIFYLPGLLAEGSRNGWVVDYLMGARSIDAAGNATMPGKFFSRSHSETRRGNHFQAGLTVGPEIYSDEKQLPRPPMIGSDLSGTSIDIGFGGLPKPSYRRIATNMASKYVVRPGGLTGVFNSDATPGQIKTYDYDVNLRRFAIRMVNNQLDTYNWLDGQINVPGKGDFDISFSSLELGCSGDVGAGRIDREACDGLDNNGNGLIDENCGTRLAAWQVPAQLISMNFKPVDPAASMCLAQSRRLEVVQSLELVKLTKPFGLQAFWSPQGDLLEHTISSTGDQQIDRPNSNSGLNGFALAPSAMQLKTPVGSDSDGWLQFSGRVGVPFWEALNVDGRVANEHYDSSGGRISAYPAPTILVAEGSLRQASEGYDNARFLTEGMSDIFWDDERDEEIDYWISSKYTWGNTGWGFGLPVEYDYKAVDKGEAPRFLGIKHQINLLVLDAQAGVNFIDPERTRLSFGASADFSKLRDAHNALDLQVDLGDPDSLRAVDSLLNKLGIRGSPLSNSLGSLQEKLNLMNNLVGPALESAIKRALLEGITLVGKQISGGDPFEQLADGMSLVQTLPAQIANTVGDQLNAAMDRATAPLIGPVDDALVEIYTKVPNILEKAPDNPSGAILEEIRAQVQQIRHAHTALNQVDSALAVAAGGLADTRSQLDSLRTQVSSWKNEINQALNLVQNNILSTGLQLSECNFGTVNGVLSSNNALMRPALDSLVKVREVATILRALEIAQTIGVPVATLADLDPQPMLVAEQQIRDLALAIEQRANQALNTAENALCPGSGQTPLSQTLTKANAFLNEIRSGMQSIDQQVTNLHIELSDYIDTMDTLLQSMRDRFAAGHTFLANLDDTLQSIIDGSTDYDYKGWAVAQIQTAMDQAAQDAFGLPWYDPIREKSFIAPLARQLRTPVDAFIAAVQFQLQQQLASVAGLVPVKSADELRTLVSNHIMDTPPVQQLLGAVNTQVAAITEELNALVTVALDQVNYLVQTAAREVEAKANEALAAASSKLDGDLPVTSAAMDGYAVIAGEELERAHLSAEWTMRGSSAENTTSYNAALDITSWNVNGKSEGCNVAAGPYGAPLDAIISTRNLPIRVSSDEILIRKLYLGFTLENLVPMGLFGGIDTQGDLDFQAFTLYDIGFAAGTGKRENYIGATANATFSSLQMSAAFLVGKTCNREVIESLDPQVGEFITLPGDIFNGAYVRGSASIPVWDIGCALRVGVAADVGSWVLASPTLTIGGLVGGGAFGKVACLGALRGQVTAMGEKSGSSFSFAGEGFGVAGAGLSCKPSTWTTVARSRKNSWCGTVDASFGARYNDGWQVDGLKFSGIH